MAKKEVEEEVEKGSKVGRRGFEKEANWVAEVRAMVGWRRGALYKVTSPTSEVLPSFGLQVELV